MRYDPRLRQPIIHAGSGANDGRTAINSISTVVKLLSYLVIVYFSTPLLVKHLGNNKYGLWVIINSITSYFTLFDLGLQSSVVHHMAKYRNDPSSPEAKTVIGQSISYYLRIAAAGTVIVVVTAVIAGRYYGATLVTGNEMMSLLIISGISILGPMPLAAFQCALLGFQRYVVVNVYGIFFTIVKNIAIVVAALWGGGLVTMMVVNCVGNILEYSAYMIIYLSNYGVVERHYFRYSGEKSSHLIRYGLKSLGNQVVGRLNLESAPLIIGHILGAGWVTFYSIPSRLISYLTQLFWSFTQVQFSVFSELIAKGDRKDIQETFLKWSSKYNLVFFPICIITSFLGGPFITWWMGVEFWDKGKYVFAFWMGTTVLACFVNLTARYFTGANRHQVLFKISAGTSALNVLLSIMLVRGHGISSVAFVTFATSLVMTVILLYVTVKETDIPLPVYLKWNFVKPAAFSVPLMVFSIWYALRFKYTGMKDVFTMAFFMIAVYLLTCAVFLMFGGIARKRQSMNGTGFLSSYREENIVNDLRKQ